ncbi:MAG: hypothetical protein LUQ51_03800 [Methanothrix sp.]|nr:hypothetical protein [Methanothrix sp.]OYV12004.1 MAG: hypothetical protein CG446_555 [Methanosaeta sp. ASO1]
MRRLSFNAILAAMLLAAGSCAAQGHCLVLGSDLFLAEDLPMTRDLNFTGNLKDILESYRYTENYSAGSFDCMDTCIIATSILQEHGYNPSTMARFALKGRDGESHMWLSVSDGLGRFAFIDTTAFASGRPVLGEVVAADESGNYSSGYVLISPMKVMQCFGYSEESFLSHLGAVEKTAAGPIVLRKESRDQERASWVYQ